MSDPHAVETLIADVLKLEGGDGETCADGAAFLQCPVCCSYNYEPHGEGCFIAKAVLIAQSLQRMLAEREDGKKAVECQTCEGRGVVGDYVQVEVFTGCFTSQATTKLCPTCKGLR